MYASNTRSSNRRVIPVARRALHAASRDGHTSGREKAFFKMGIRCALGVSAATGSNTTAPAKTRGLIAKAASLKSQHLFPDIYLLIFLRARPPERVAHEHYGPWNLQCVH